MRYLLHAAAAVLMLSMWLNSSDGRQAKARLLASKSDAPRVYADN